MTHCTLPLEYRSELATFLREFGIDSEIIENVLTIGDQTQADFLWSHIGPWIDRVRVEYNVEEPIYLVLLSSHEIQALAIKLQSGVYCIALYLGALIEPGKVAVNLSFSTNMASLLKLKSGDPINPDLIAKGTQFEAVASLAFLPEWDERSDGFRGLLYKLPSIFLICHELGHILNGHLSSGDQQGGCFFIAERTRHDIAPDNHITDHTLEMDADAFAVGCLLALVLDDRHPWFMRRFQAELSVKLAAIEIAIHSVFKAFDLHPYTTERMFSEDHPHAAMRIASAASLLPNFIFRRLGTPVEEQQDPAAFIRFAFEVEKGLGQFTGKIEVDNLRAAFVDLAKWEDVVRARWAKLYPQLTEAKLSKGNLAPPSVEPA